MKKLIKAFSLMILSLFLVGLYAPYPCVAHQEESIYNLEIEILPPNPTCQNDVQIIISGEWGNPGYEIASHTYSIVDKKITIEATIDQKPGIWAQVITNWEFAQDIGRLAAGSYTVEANVNGVTHTAEFIVVRGGFEVIEGEQFEISFEQVLHPSYEWLLKEYDPEYVKFVSEDFMPPPSQLIGTTIKTFTFEALQKGLTEIVFADCELDQDGNPVAELNVKSYLIVIN